MKRIISAVCTTAAIAFSVTSLPLVAQTDSSKPNILLIIADDMGLDASDCYQVGQNQAKMPNIEALCATGMVFENAYSAPVCSPTRATILTGKYGFRTDVCAAMRPNNRAGLSGEEVSLFDVLKPAGYASAVIGKWHVAGLGDTLDHPEILLTFYQTSH